MLNGYFGDNVLPLLKTWTSPHTDVLQLLVVVFCLPPTVMAPASNLHTCLVPSKPYVTGKHGFVYYLYCKSRSMYRLFLNLTNLVIIADSFTGRLRKGSNPQELRDTVLTHWRLVHGIWTGLKEPVLRQF